MYHIVYISKALFQVTESDLRTILQHSRKNNSLQGITGMLLYGNDYFIQLLEGEKEAVQTAFNRILKDNRHHVEYKLADGPVSERTFPEWSMGYKFLADPDLEQFSGYIDPTNKNFLAGNIELDEESVLTVLRSFAQTNINDTLFG